MTDELFLDLATVARPPNATPQTTQRHAAVVVGMHRSGTSLATGLLSKFGFTLPGDDIGPRRGNERGHFESAAVNELNDRVLSDAGLHWSSLEPVDHAVAQQRFLSEMCETIHNSFGYSGDFVLKDPRITKLVPLWRAALAKTRARAMFVHVFRDATSVAQSLSKRDGFRPSHCRLLWLSSNLYAEKETRDCDRFFVAFEDLITDWPGVLAHQISSFAPERQLSSEGRVAGHQFVDRRIVGTDSADYDPNESPWITGTFEALCALHDDPFDPAAMATLDSIRSEFEASLPFLTDLCNDALNQSPANAVESNGAPDESSELRAARLALLIAKDAAIGAEVEAGEARSAAEELSISLASAEHQLELLRSAGDALSQTRRSPTNVVRQRLAEEIRSRRRTK